ncbi:DUF397 domain-containing protein [Micromonospora orduensis]
MHLSGAVWRTSTSGECDETAGNLPGVMGARDSRDQTCPVLMVAPAAWRAFVAAARRPTA